jgi:hypothetical protein
MRLVFFVIVLLIGSVFAATVKADVRAVKDTGNENLPKMNVGITIDCDSKALIVEPKSNTTGEPIASAQTYLFYTDYEYQLVGTGSTNASGISKINVIGNQDFLTALFILRVDKSGFRSRETEFTYKYCFQDPPDDIGDVYGEDEPDEPPPELKKLELDIKPVCSGTAVTGETAIVKSEGVPLSGAYVSVEDLNPAKKIAAGNTDGTGQFQFPGCGDEYNVRASKGGYESVEVNVTLMECNECPLPPPPPVQPPASQQQNGSDGSGKNETPKPGTEGSKPAPSACPLGLLVLSILALRARP